MTKVIDELLVEIGADVNNSEFDDAKSAFDNVRSSALLMGAGVTAAFAGVLKITSDTAEEWDNLGKQALYIGTSAQYIRDVGIALQFAGGQADEAGQLIDNIGSKIREIDKGPLAEQLSIASLGQFNINKLLNIDDTKEAITFISNELSKLDEASKRRVSDVLGLTQSQFVALSTGSEAFTRSLDEAKKFAGVFEGLEVDSAEFNDAVLRMQLAFGRTADIIGEDFMPILTSAANSIADIVTFINDLLQSDKEKPLFENPTVISTTPSPRVQRQVEAMGQVYLQGRQLPQNQTFTPGSAAGAAYMAGKGIKTTNKPTYMAGKEIKTIVTNHNKITINAQGMTPNQVKQIFDDKLNAATEQTIQDVNVEAQ